MAFPIFSSLPVLFPVIGVIIVAASFLIGSRLYAKAPDITRAFIRAV
jgi:hypothetical protein